MEKTPPPGFEPGTIGLTGCFIDYGSLRQDFVKWLKSRVDQKTAYNYLNYLDKYLMGVTITCVDDLIDISLTVNGGWNWYAKAVRNLINYCVEKRIISKPVATELKETLKIKKTGSDTWVPSDSEVKNMFAKINREDMKMLFKLLYYSGIRLIEAIKILNEFDIKKLHYDSDVAYYDIDWSRGCKNAFKAFMPASFAQQLTKLNITENAVIQYIQRHKLIPAKYARNWFINKLVKAGIQESIIRFMIGHSNGSVLMTNYLEKLNNSIHAYRKALPLLQSVLEQ